MSLSLIDVDDKEIIDAIRAKYNYHFTHSLKYKSMLDAYNGSITPANDSIQIKKTEVAKNNDVPKTIPKPLSSNKLTFENVILNILSDGQPRLVSELIEEYFKLTGKRLKTKDFSSKLSIRAKSGNKIKNVKFNDFPIEKRFWWGKSDWLEGNLLKPEYVEKVHTKFKNM